jgi:hypothetical protein
MMPEESRFFRVLWRFNAILLAVVGILAIGLLGTAALQSWMWRHNYQPPPEGHFTPVPKAAEQSFTYRLSVQPDFVLLRGEQFYALQRWKGSPSSYGLAMADLTIASSSAYHYTDAVNLLAVNTGTGASHWLFDGYRRAVIDQRAIYSGGPLVSNELPTSKDPTALVIRTVDNDTNNDGQLDFKDRQTLYAYRPGDTRAVKFFEADYIISMGEVEGGNFFVVYEKGQSAIAATFSVPDFKLKSQHQLPNVPQ